MKTKINFNVLLICITVLGAITLMSFGKTTAGKKLALIKVYQGDSEFNNAITIAYPGGTVEKIDLLPNKVKNFEANEKQIQKAVNTLTNLGYRMLDITSTSTGNFAMTQFVFEE